MSRRAKSLSISVIKDEEGFEHTEYAAVAEDGTMWEADNRYGFSGWSPVPELPCDPDDKDAS